MFKLRKIDNIWLINERRLSRWRKFGLRMLKRVSIVVECMSNQNIMSHASALTYNTLLAAVPVLAIVFAIARGFGFDNFMEERMRESFEANPDIADTIMAFVNSFLQHTRGGVFIGVGLVFLLYTLLNLATNMETAFNAIWHVRHTRNIYRRITDYLSVFLLMPFAIVILSGFNIFLISFRSILPDYQIVNTTMERLLQLSPMVLACVAFIMLYKFMPNTKVKFSSTVWPGIFAGLLFMGVEYLYIHYQIKLSSYNAIYGSFAVLPLFMIWLQISWSICLVGGQLCYANQSIESYAIERECYDMSRRQKDTISLLLVSRICKRFVSGLSPYTERSLVYETHLPESLVRLLLGELVSMGILAETNTEDGTPAGYLPAMDVERMTVRTVLRQIDKYGSERVRCAWHLDTPEMEKLRRLRYDWDDALLSDI